MSRLLTHGLTLMAVYGIFLVGHALYQHAGDHQAAHASHTIPHLESE